MFFETITKEKLNFPAFVLFIGKGIKVESFKVDKHLGVGFLGRQTLKTRRSTYKKVNKNCLGHLGRQKQSWAFRSTETEDKNLVNKNGRGHLGPQKLKT